MSSCTPPWTVIQSVGVYTWPAMSRNRAIVSCTSSSVRFMSASEGAIVCQSPARCRSAPGALRRPRCRRKAMRTNLSDETGIAQCPGSQLECHTKPYHRDLPLAPTAPPQVPTVARRPAYTRLTTIPPPPSAIRSLTDAHRLLPRAHRRLRCPPDKRRASTRTIVVEGTRRRQWRRRGDTSRFRTVRGGRRLRIAFVARCDAAWTDSHH